MRPTFPRLTSSTAFRPAASHGCAYCPTQTSPGHILARQRCGNDEWLRHRGNSLIFRGVRELKPREATCRAAPGSEVLTGIVSIVAGIELARSKGTGRV